MALFQTAVLNKYLKQQDSDVVAKAYTKFVKYFHNPTIQKNIRERKEEQFQEGFLIELFVNVLGYTLAPNPTFNLTTELKNEKGAKKADGAILSRSKDPLAKPFALGVIELKSTKTKDLEKVRQQAFDYKANQTGCVYVITSNFEKVRFYINNAVEFEEFDLFTINRERFELLYLCLAKDNLLGNVPLKIKEASIQEEEKITKKFYADYSLFKRELFRDLVKLNMKNEVFRAELNTEDTERANKNIKHHLFKKSQKLIDRFLFIFFAEDRGLLPPNSTLKILEQWDKLKDLDAYAPLYERYKLYFNYLDTGRKGSDKSAEIFAYNGGLFKPDAILDSLQISDELLYRCTKELQAYDFESQVDVNILGHIFENSLNEIESVNAEIEGTDFDKQKTKRKKDGVFYTPKYITKYIVDNTVGKLCNDKKEALKIIEEEFHPKRQKETKKKLLAALETYRKWLLQLTILDPACGSGAFLNQALDFLIKEHGYIDELQTNLLGGGLVFPNIENTVLENNIFGVDINEESVDIARLSLWLRTAQPRRKLNDLSENIKCGNSLIDDPKVAGDKAFKWEEEFPNIFEEKEKKAWHITTATHDSRTSQRMIDYKVRELRDNGMRPKAEGIWLEPEDEMLITQTIAEIVKEDNLNVMAYNICGDHIHVLLVCEEEEVSKIMQKIKAKTSRAVNIHKGITTTREHSESDITREHAPLSNTRGKKQNSLWTQKFGCKEINDDKHLWNTVEYIQNNREKHELPPFDDKGACSLVETIKEMCCTYDHAFRAETTGGFDVVIGNPPYVDIKALDSELVKYLFKYYKTTENRINLYSIFIEKAYDLVKSNGFVSFINPNSILVNSSYKKIRTLLIDEMTRIIKLPDDVFVDAKVETIIFEFRKNNRNKFINILVYPKDEKIDCIDNYRINIFEKSVWKSDENLNYNIFLSIDDINLLNKIKKNSTTELGEISDFCLGITPYDKYQGHSSETIKTRAFHSKTKLDSTYKPLITGSNILRFSVTNKSEEYIKYDDWLGAMREERFFTSPRIIVRQIVSGKPPRIYAGYTEESLYFTQIGFSIIPKETDSIKYILTLLNSKLITYYHKYQYLDIEKNLFQKILIANCKQVPIKEISKVEQLPFINKAETILILNEKAQKVVSKFSKYIQSQFSIEKFSKKLQNWHELEFGDFIKELNKAIKNNKGLKPLGKLEEMEWMEVFETKKAEAQTLKTEIDKTDAEIDAMVYELYGLSEEEIKIVENN